MVGAGVGVFIAGVVGPGVAGVGLVAASPASEPHDALLQSAKADIDQVMKEPACEKRCLVMRR
jgi:hypothetical protein